MGFDRGRRAHHFRNRQTLLWKMAAELRRNYILLLTATPVQNDLESCSTWSLSCSPACSARRALFQRQFVDRHDKLMPRNVDQLHQLLGEAMVRNRRSTGRSGADASDCPNLHRQAERKGASAV